MHLYPTKKKRSAARFALPLVLSAAVLLLFLYGFSTMGDSTGTEKLRAARRAIDAAVVNCYAVEGMYPAQLSYLEEHYGLLLDHDAYYVYYSTFGSNIKPIVKVIPYGSTGEEDIE